MEKPRGKASVVEAIIDAAVPLIAERGVAGVSFRDIAQAANVNHGLITRHFGTKDALVIQIAEHLVRVMYHDAVRNGENMKTLWDQGFLEQSVAIKALTRILLDVSMVGNEPPTSFINEILGWIQGQQASLALNSDDDPQVLLFLVASLLIGSEVVGPHVKYVLKLPDDAYKALKIRVFRALEKGNFAAPVGSSL